MSGTEASEDNESSGGLKKQNFTGEADLTDVVMHDSDDLGTRRLWAECVATLTSPHDLRTDEGDIVIGRPIPCHIRAKIGDISDASYASGQLAFNRAVRSPDGEEVAPNSFGMMLNLHPITPSRVKRGRRLLIADHGMGCDDYGRGDR